MSRLVGPALLALLLLVPMPAWAEPLRLPFAVAPEPPPGSALPPCPQAAPPPVVALDLASIYDPDDESRSAADPARLAAYAAGIAAPRAFGRQVAEAAGAYTASGGAKGQAAACALLWLERWAKADALNDLASRQAGLSATRILAGLSLAFLQVRGAADAAGVDRQAIEAWLRRRAEAVPPLFEGTGERRSDRQNHRYWGGLAAAAAGVAVGERALFDWGIESYRIGVCQIDADGALPLELARRARAREYHLHAVAPLVMIAELAEANGVDAYGFCGGAIHRLVTFTLRSVEDPAAVERLAGASQRPLPEADGQPRGDLLAWVEPYLRRFPDRATPAALRLRRPLSASSLGGDMTALFPKAP